MLPILKSHPTFRDYVNLLSWPDQTVAHILDSAFVAEKVGVASSAFELVWTIMQDAIHVPMSSKAGKSWIADARLVKLLDSSNPTMMLMNPGPVSYMRLYANWNDDDRIESRVGRAVGNALRQLRRDQRRNSTKLNITEIRSTTA